MKNLYYILLILSLLSTPIFAQNYDRPFGKPTLSELQMTTHPDDSSAVAAVIYDIGKSAHEYLGPGNGIGVVFRHKKKIKILKPEGVNLANISIHCNDFGSNRRQESISELEAWVYNLEDGKIVKQKLEKQHIFKEKASETHTIIKLGLQGVKVGSVIEYKYTKTIINSLDVPSWQIQGSIPVMYSQYTVEVPDYFSFRWEVKGYEQVDVFENWGSAQLPIGPARSCKTQIRVYQAYDIPALEYEDYVWCVNDFRSSIKLELNGIQIPGELYKNYSMSWQDVENTLRMESDFMNNIRGANPYKEDVQKIVLAMADNQVNMVETILRLVNSKIRWNGSYAMIDNNPREAIKNGTGNNAQINSVIYRALKDAKLSPYLVLMSLRNYGRLPLAQASLNALNTYIVAVELSDGQICYMDGSTPYGWINMLNTNLMVDKARVFKDSPQDGGWVDLTNICPSATVRSQTITIDENGEMRAKATSLYSNVMAVKFMKDYKSYSDSIKYIEDINLQIGVTIDSLEISESQSTSNSIQTVMVATKQCNYTDQFIYINPLFIAHNTINPFTKAERKLPLEFEFPYSYVITSTITIPDGYQVEELPKSASMTLNENNASMSYKIGQEGNTIYVSYVFRLRQTLFPNTEYQDVKAFWEMMCQKNDEMIVLKKI